MHGKVLRTQKRTTSKLVHMQRYLSNEKVPFYELLVRAGLFELTAYWMEHSMQDGETAVKETRQDAVKQAADRITLGNDADGVAVVIEALPGIDNRHVSLSL